MIYVKSFAVGIFAVVIYAVLVPLTKVLIIPLSALYYLILVDDLRKWHLIARPNSPSGSVGVYGGSFHLTSPLFLLFAALIFVGASYWKFRRLTRSL